MNETTRILIEAGVILAFALLVGPRVAREASEREPVRSGGLAQVLNLIASMAVAALLPGLIVGLILGGAHFTFPIILSLLATTFISMLLFSVLEVPARKQVTVTQSEDEDLWTAEKARTSGL